MSTNSRPRGNSTPTRATKLVAWLLDPPAETPHWHSLESIALLLWIAVAAFAVWQHVPWADEMQAWFLAGEVSWKTLFVHNLHYEGTGGLWHAFLKLCHELHLPFTAVRYLAAGVQAAAIALLLRNAPFPRAVRLLLPFSFFLLYQDTVVARSYCLLALLAFLAAGWLRRGRPRPLALALVLGLMANISVHGAILSGSLAIVAAAVWRGRFLKRPAAICLLLCLWFAAAAAMAPAYDIDYQAGNNLRRSFARVEQRLGIQATPPPSISSLSMYGLRPAPRVVHWRSETGALWHRIARLLAVVTFPISAFRVLALLVAAAIILQACLQRRSRAADPVPASLGALGLIPWAAMVLVFTSLYLAPRHAGTVFTGFIVSAWLTWPAAGQLRRRCMIERATAALLLLACAESVAWSAHAIVKEHRLPYSAGRMTADFLKSQGVAAPGSTKTVAGFYYFSINTLLYFHRNLYFNQPPHRYWLWSTQMRTYMNVQQVLAHRPDFVIIGGFDLGRDNEITDDWQPVAPGAPGVVRGDEFSIEPFFESHGYRETHVFCGHTWMRATYAERLCDTVLQPARP